MKRFFFPSFLLAFLFLFCPAHSQNTSGAGYCLSFNGSNQYISIPHDSSLNATSGLTLEAWIYPTNFAANTWANVIIGKDGWANGEEGYSLRCGGTNSLSFNIGTSNGWQEALATNVLATNTWQHVAATYDGTTMRVYVNGVEVATNNYSGSIQNSTYDLNIARIPYTSGGPRHFQGEVDEVRMWAATLPPATLRSWMCRKVTSTHPNYSTLGGYWRFDDAMGFTLSDQSPNSNDGTLNNGPIWGFSGAAIGDTSTYTYTMPFNLNMNGASPAGDFSVSLASGTPNGIHLYQVNAAPNLPNLPTGYTSYFTSTYWGVFMADSSGALYDVSFDYSGNQQVNANNECAVALAARTANNSAVWYDIGATLDIAMDELSRNNMGQQQYILGLNPQPFPLVALNQLQFCQGDTVRMETNPGSGNTYAWFRNGTAIPGATTPAYTATQSGDYHVMVTKNSCNYSTDTATVNVIPLPTVSQAAAGPYCINDTAQMLPGGTPSGGVYSGAGVNGNFFDPLLAGLGSVPLAYAFTDANGCTGVDTQMVMINPAPSVLFNPLADICDNAAPLALSTGIPNGGVYSGPGVNMGTFDPTTTGPGSFPMTYTFTDPNGCSDSASTNLTVNAAPATPTISVSGNVLTSSAASGNQWLNNGQAIPGATGVTFSATASGAYSVVVTDSNGCQSDTAMAVTYVGLDLPSGPKLSIFPNPASDAVTLTWHHASPGALRIELVDAMGKILAQSDETSVDSGAQTRALSLENLPAGIYFVRLETAVGATQRLLIKQ